MTDAPYTPPKVWTWVKENGGKFASINRPIAGPTHEQALPRGQHPLQLYSLGTPNGAKVTIMLEELLMLLEEMGIEVRDDLRNRRVSQAAKKKSSKANPGKLSYASSGFGAASHLFTEAIKDHGVVERAPLLEGKSMHITVASTHKPKVEGAAERPAPAAEPMPAPAAPAPAVQTATAAREVPAEAPAPAAPEPETPKPPAKKAPAKAAAAKTRSRGRSPKTAPPDLH